MPLWISILGYATTIILLEGGMWMLFEKRVIGMCLPKTNDASGMRLLSVNRLRIFALMHTVLMILFLIYIHLLLW